MNGDERPDGCSMLNFIAVSELGLFYDPATNYYCPMNSDGTPDCYEDSICDIEDNEYSNEEEKQEYLAKIQDAVMKLKAVMRPKVDLNKCKRGDKLRSKHGMILTYLERMGEDRSSQFPHLVEYPDGSHGTRTDEGWTYRHRPLPTDHDIVEILP